MPSLLVALCLALPVPQAPHAADLEVLLVGVRTIGRPGVPGPIAVFGEQAFAVVTGACGGSHLAVVAATELGEGRVVAFGHGGYLAGDTLEEGDTGRLLGNSLRWAARAEEPAVGVRHGRGMIESLAAVGVRATELRRLDEESLATFDAVVVELEALDVESLSTLAKYVRSGGGLVTAGLGWGWQQLHPNEVLNRDHRGNRFLHEAGLLFGLGYVDSIDPVGEPIDDGGLDRVNALHALQRLAKLAEEHQVPAPDEARALSGPLVYALRSLPPEDEAFRPLVREVVASAGETRTPTAERPLRTGDALDRLALVLRHDRASLAPPEKTNAEPSAVDFPGAVPSNAPRVAEGSDDATVRLDLAVPGWHSTGLYAPAGEELVVRAPAELTDRGGFVRIGSHSDLLWTHDAWHRHPEVCVRRRLSERETPIASPHGGLLYVEVPRGLSGTAEVEIPGAALAPLFVLGETDPALWRERLAGATAPWAELACERVILTIPTDVARRLEDPTEVMELWQRVLGYYAELGARPLDVQPQRFVTDRQISAGYMHSGYPIMTHLDAAERMIDAALLRRAQGGEWGVWHELGHNHQQPDWTFDGTVEVTCNLFTLFVIEKLSGVAPAENPTLDDARRRAAEHVASGAPFDRWKADPFLALVMYVELQEAFGWELFEKVFAEYAALPAGERPRSDDEKRDQWLVRLSRAAGRDFGPFFERWGLPTSDAARAAVAALEDWLP